ncbi:MAG: glutathione S-transferase family protein [Rhizobiaceae bacterium]|nr:glutathione S-transferase family protein [Rhizobiaceae bacterium]
MYTLIIANKNYSSWSLRAWLLLRELAIPFEEEMRPFSDDIPDRGAISPSGKVPCLLHDDLSIWDSLAITEYIAERHVGIWPANARARAFGRSAAAEMHSGFQALRNVCTMNCGLRVRLSAHSPALHADVARLSALWNDGLERFGGPYLVGERFTAADAFFAPVAFRFATYGLAAEGAAEAYPARLLALEGMREWHAAALLEPYRDREHEEEAKAAGEWLEDRRLVA